MPPMKVRMSVLILSECMCMREYTWTHIHVRNSRTLCTYAIDAAATRSSSTAACCTHLDCILPLSSPPPPPQSSAGSHSSRPAHATHTIPYHTQYIHTSKEDRLREKSYIHSVHFFPFLSLSSLLSLSAADELLTSSTTIFIHTHVRERESRVVHVRRQRHKRIFIIYMYIHFHILSFSPSP